ncbi:hypothetical protein AWB74_06523 [Caballeronia arvi]|uniref:Uncharacterized protein n=1 Tax=Caballeronia arvi TaxID=1777135 RepID=A0A158KPW5_9BURK|nr:hypothetical protein AWB74_06523 [Caballeronia arvi]
MSADNGWSRTLNGMPAAGASAERQKTLTMRDE